MRVLVLMIACACSSKQGTGVGRGTGPGGARPVDQARTCDDVKPRIAQLYRDEARGKPPKRVDEAVADNTAMVMNDCAKDPATVVPCLAGVTSVAELERHCLIALDDEGSEGDRR
jgi:hypothetical protein